MKRKVLLPILVAMVLAGIVTTVLYLRHNGGEEGVIVLSGNIEVDDVELSFRIAGRVDRRLVDEGEAVKALQPVALLDRHDQEQAVAMRQADLDAAAGALAELEAGSRPQEIAAAKAAVGEAQAALAALQAGSRPQEKAAAHAAIDQAKASLEQRQIEYDRLTRLQADGKTTTIEFTAGKTALEAAKAALVQAQQQAALVDEGPRKEDIDRAQAALARAQANHDLVLAGPRKEDIDQAKARVQAAQAARAMAQLQLDYTTLASPIDGIVLSKSVESGEFVAPGTTVVTVGNMAHVYLRLYLAEGDLGRVKIGQPVRITTDSYPDRTYEGRVSFISQQAEFTPKSVQTAEQRVKLVYRIKVDAENPKMELKPGMPADARIEVGKE
ncbi:MAG: hypothetical protein BIFFINMI_03277 [Phycisphaerae bacterium]|nr:hypothetical protein [Phycisphaerae bacterium]